MIKIVNRGIEVSKSVAAEVAPAQDMDECNGPFPMVKRTPTTGTPGNQR